MEADYSIWEIFGRAVGVLVVLSPIWLPVVLIYLFGKLWMTYIRLKKIQEEDYLLLEVKLPKEIEKSPAAMELVLSAFWQSDPAANFIDKYWEGKFMPWFSLELVSIGGQVHFFIWTSKKHKNIIESRIYAQYPNVEIYEVPDYTDFINFADKQHDLWGTEYKLNKPDPYPIQTYIDFKLHEDPKEFFKIDPLVSFVEFLGSVPEDHQVWHQILVRKHEKRRGRKSLFKKSDWKDDAKDLVKKLKDEWTPTGEEGKKTQFSEFALTENQRNTIKAIERSVTKNGYEVGIRSLIIGPADSLDKSNIGGLLGSFFQVNSQELNALKPNNTTGFKYPWQDFNGKRMDTKKKRLFKAYKARGYFYRPFKGKPFVMNTEELATIYHFPGGVAQTPTFGRIGSKKSEPPTNLPV